MVRAETAAAQVPSKATCPDTQEVTAQLKGSKSDSAITKHLKLSPECRSDVCGDVLKRFQILARGKSTNHLAILEALFIAQNKPCLCSQKGHVRCLRALLTWNCCDFLIVVIRCLAHVSFLGIRCVCKARGFCRQFNIKSWLGFYPNVCPCMNLKRNGTKLVVHQPCGRCVLCDSMFTIYLQFVYIYI